MLKKDGEIAKEKRIAEAAQYCCLPFGRNRMLQLWFMRRHENATTTRESPKKKHRLEENNEQRGENAQVWRTLASLVLARPVVIIVEQCSSQSNKGSVGSQSEEMRRRGCRGIGKEAKGERRRREETEVAD